MMAAELSLKVLGLCSTQRVRAYSQRIQLATDVIITVSAFRPKNNTAIRAAGIRAIITSLIMIDVLIGELICGAVDILSIGYFPLLSFFSSILPSLQVSSSGNLPGHI